MQPVFKIGLFACLMMIGFLMMSCTMVYTVPKEPVTYSSVEKINMKVALHLDDTLCDAKWEKNVLTDSYIVPIGGPLCINSESLARTLFAEVTVLDDQVTDLPTDVNAVLIPNLVSIERSRPLTIYSTQITSILFTWSLNDRSGDPIWVTTISGEGKGPMGSPLSKDAGHEQIEMLLDDVFQQSLREMSSSPLIREFAANQRQSTP